MPRWISSLCALLLLAWAPAADAQMYLRLVGSIQGPIDGDVVFGPLTGTVAISSLSLSVIAEIDPTTGLPTGRISVTPLTLTKVTDSATIGILRALDRGEALNTCVLDAYRITPADNTQLYLRLTLTGARISTWDFGTGRADPGSESCSIEFDSLEWHDYDTGDVYSYTMGTSVVNGAFDRGLAVVTSPNPTSGPTEFSFRMPTTGDVSIEVYDSRGRHVATVFDGRASVDQGIAVWDGRDTLGRQVANGVYMVTMRAGEWLTTTKMSVLR